VPAKTLRIFAGSGLTYRFARVKETKTGSGEIYGIREAAVR
jgi:hypothetical protein